METIYDVDYFIKKFEAIPENEWCIRIQQNSLGQRCAYGHCLPEPLKREGKLLEAGGHLTMEGEHLSKVFGITEFNPAMVNNGDYTEYPQPTPKQRILAALYDIKGNSAVNEAVAIVSQPSHETVSNEAV